MHERRILRLALSRTARAGRVPPELLARALLVNSAWKVERRLQPAAEEPCDMTLEVGEVEHLDGIEHIDYGRGFEVMDLDAGERPARVSVFEIEPESEDECQAR